MLPITNAEVIASIVSVPVVIALAALFNGVLKVIDRYKPLVAWTIAILVCLFANWILEGDWRIAVARGVLVGLVASGVYSGTRAMANH